MCLLRNLQNPLIGTVHIFADHPDAVRQPRATTGTNLESPSPAETAQHGPSPHRYSNERGSHDTDTSWVETGWMPPVLKGLNATLAGETESRWHVWAWLKVDGGLSKACGLQTCRRTWKRQDSTCTTVCLENDLFRRRRTIVA